MIAKFWIQFEVNTKFSMHTYYRMHNDLDSWRSPTIQLNGGEVNRMV